LKRGGKKGKRRRAPLYKEELEGKEEMKYLFHLSGGKKEGGASLSCRKR